jgi:hypothetical protein
MNSANVVVGFGVGHPSTRLGGGNRLLRWYDLIGTAKPKVGTTPKYYGYMRSPLFYVNVILPTAFYSKICKGKADNTRFIYLYNNLKIAPFPFTS